MIDSQVYNYNYRIGIDSPSGMGYPRGYGLSGLYSLVSQNLLTFTKLILLWLIISAGI